METKKVKLEIEMTEDQFNRLEERRIKMGAEHNLFYSSSVTAGAELFATKEYLMGENIETQENPTVDHINYLIDRLGQKKDHETESKE